MTTTDAEGRAPKLAETTAQVVDHKALAAARRRRSLALALVLGAFVIIVFVVTLTRLGGNVASWAP